MKPVVIIGAGMAGLQAASQLHLNQIAFLLVDAQNHVGGRLHSEHAKGFTLDVGFQVLQTNYPEVQRSLDLPALDLAAFESGAYLWNQDGWLAFVNPLKQPRSLFDALASGMMTVKDAYLLARLWFMTQADVQPLGSQESTQDFLNRWGFSTKFQAHFWRDIFVGWIESASFLVSLLHEAVFRGDCGDTCCGYRRDSGPTGSCVTCGFDSFGDAGDSGFSASSYFFGWCYGGCGTCNPRHRRFGCCETTGGVTRKRGFLEH
jgi:phytoene dehydrogenase-like protein